MAHIRTALDTAYLRRDLVILLGIEPETPEIEYGWIEPTALAKGHAKIFGVRVFGRNPIKSWPRFCSCAAAYGTAS
jgi:mannose-1-phosphate guanylyltransferase